MSNNASRAYLPTRCLYISPKVTILRFAAEVGRKLYLWRQLAANQNLENIAHMGSTVGTKSVSGRGGRTGESYRDQRQISLHSVVGSQPGEGTQESRIRMVIDTKMQSIAVSGMTIQATTGVSILS